MISNARMNLFMSDKISMRTELLRADFAVKDQFLSNYKFHGS